MTPGEQAAPEVSGIDAEGFADVAEAERRVGLLVLVFTPNPALGFGGPVGVAVAQLNDGVEQHGEHQAFLRHVGRAQRHSIEELLG
jgi:hypothetical protein